jgi:hypothetical protein
MIDGAADAYLATGRQMFEAAPQAPARKRVSKARAA